MQKTPILILLAILSLLFTNPVIAEDAVIYDSGELAITSWHVHLSKHTFEASHPKNGCLNIKKNTPGLDIQAGFLILNFRLIPLTRFLTGPDSTFKKEIKLRQTNRLRVILIGSLGASITITVHDEEENQPPAVNFSAEPETIVAGSTSTLSWSSEHADSCAIEPGIGAVDTVGSITFSPAATTTYTITAIGSGGTVSSSVTVTVDIPAPTITLSADPLQIVQGGSSTLAWSTVNADAVSIDQGIGNVQTAGSRVIFPDSDTTYAITATGPGGISTRSVTVTVVSPISIQVISPVDGESINRPDVMVHGTFSNTTLGETGITVNGKVAETWNGHFVVNHVPLQEGSNAITVTATDQNGYVQTASVSVPAAIPEHHIEISSNIESGSSPLELTLHINGTFSINDSTMSHNGPGSVELIETEPDEYHVSLIDEGITYFTAEVVHETVTYKDTMAVVVVDIAEIDALLQQKWVDMKTQLSERNVEGAIQYFDDSKKSLYDELFSVLIDGLPQIANDMQNISIISVTDKIAKYRIRRIETHGAVSYPITYYIYFINNENGIWKIHRF